ncbi:MAG: hypothetical protein R3B96_04055 [Pirellulaceae bacterium]
MTWNEDDYAWKTELPGKGHSCPVVWGDKIFFDVGRRRFGQALTSSLSIARMVSWFGLGRTSRPHTLHAQHLREQHTGRRRGECVCRVVDSRSNAAQGGFDHDGQERWTRDLGPFVSQHGFGTSPIVVDGQLVLFFEQQKDQLPAEETPGQSKIMAFDCASGETLWGPPVNTTRVCYSVPCVRELPGGETELVTCNTGNGIFAVNPANGRINWEINVFSQRLRRLARSVWRFGDRQLWLGRWQQ